jgi:hypothetical protein
MKTKMLLLVLFLASSFMYAQKAENKYYDTEEVVEPVIVWQKIKIPGSSWVRSLISRQTYSGECDAIYFNENGTIEQYSEIGDTSYTSLVLSKMQLFIADNNQIFPERKANGQTWKIEKMIDSDVLLIYDNDASNSYEQYNLSEISINSINYLKINGFAVIKNNNIPNFNCILIRSVKKK